MQKHQGRIRKPTQFERTRAQLVGSIDRDDDENTKRREMMQTQEGKQKARKEEIRQAHLKDAMKKQRKAEHENAVAAKHAKHSSY